jgi:hypothetical protein
MRSSRSRKNSGLEDDLQRLGKLAYHRLEGSGDLVRRFRRFRKSEYADFRHLQTLYDWLFVPLTLWPVDIEGLMREALRRVNAGKRLDKIMVLLIEMLPSVPSVRTQQAVCEHEHSVQRGNYESLIRAVTNTIKLRRNLSVLQRFRPIGLLSKTILM